MTLPHLSQNSLKIKTMRETHSPHFFGVWAAAGASSTCLHQVSEEEEVTDCVLAVVGSTNLPGHFVPSRPSGYTVRGRERERECGGQFDAAAEKDQKRLKFFKQQLVACHVSHLERQPGCWRGSLYP